MGLLDGRVAIVTGAGRGIGRSEALLLAREGAAVVVNDLGGDRTGEGAAASAADAVVAEIEAAGGRAVANYDTVATMDGGRRIAQSAVDAFGRLDVLVNNAGILRDKSLLKMEEAQFDCVVAVHLKGTFACGQAAARIMAEAGRGGRIINTTSYSGLIGNFGQTNYAAAKAGVYGMTRVWAQELVKYNVTANAIAPIAKTRLTEDLPMFAGIGDEMSPDLIAPVVLYLASDLSAEVTGRVFGIQGGKLFEYYMHQTDGVVRDAAQGPWSAKEIASRLSEIIHI